jgi:hypothetical protein
VRVHDRLPDKVSDGPGRERLECLHPQREAGRPALLRSARSDPSLNGLLPTSWAPSIYRDPPLPFASLEPAGVGIRFGRKRCFSRTVPCSRIALSLSSAEPVTSSRSLPPSRG